MKKKAKLVKTVNIDGIDTLFTLVEANKKRIVFSVVPLDDEQRPISTKAIKIEINITKKQVLVNGKVVADLGLLQGTKKAKGKAENESTIGFVVRHAKIGVQTLWDVTKRVAKGSRWLILCIQQVIHLSADLLFISSSAILVVVMFQKGIISAETAARWGLGWVGKIQLPQFAMAVNSSIFSNVDVAKFVSPVLQQFGFI